MVRLASGLLLGSAFLAVIWFANTYVLLVVALAVCALAFREYAQLMHRIGADLPKTATLLGTLAAVAVVPFPLVAGEPVIGMSMLVIAVAVMARVSGASASAAAEMTAATRAAAGGMLGVVYLGLPMGALVAIHLFGGRGAVVLLIFSVVVSDTAQYYAGRTLGRHPLAPRLSPKKTIEGAAGGLIVVPIVLYFLGPYLVPVGSAVQMAALGVPLVVAGIAGDLFESMLKRAADLKDSSTLIPGHGGVLDRIDALLFATPIFYMYLRNAYTI